MAFSSFAGNLVTGDTNSKEGIFVHDRQTHKTTRVSIDSSGQELKGTLIRPQSQQTDDMWHSDLTPQT